MGIKKRTGQILSITVSIHRVHRHQHLSGGDCAQAIVGWADQALYLAKGTGKNRVVSKDEFIFGGGTAAE